MPNSLFELAGGLEKQRDLQEVHHPAHDRGEDGAVLGLHAVDGHLWVSVVKDEQSTPCPEESNKLCAVTVETTVVPGLYFYRFRFRV